MEAELKEKLKERIPDDVRMTFGEHLEELRWRLIKCVVMLLATCMTCMVVYEPLVWFVTRPHFKAMMMLGAKNATFISTSPQAPIWAVMKLGFILGTFIASPWIGYQIWAFVSSGLFSHEKKWAIVFAPISLLLFTGGCVFGYFILIPYGLYGMAKMMWMPEIMTPTYALADYLNLVMTLTLATGTIFQLPLIMCFTTAIGVTTAKTWWKWTRIALVVIFIAAAVLTPSPDIYTQLLMSVPLVVLYFLGMAMCLLIRPTKRGAKAA